MSKPKPHSKQLRSAAAVAPDPALKQREQLNTAKKSVSINPMFDQAKSLKRQRDEENIEPVKPSAPQYALAQPDFFQNSGQTKRQKALPKPGYFQLVTAPGAAENTSDLFGSGGPYKRFGEAQMAEETALGQRLAQEFEARRNGRAANGKRVKRAHIPTEEEIEELEAELEAVNRNVDDEIIEINNGKTIRDVRIGDTLNVYYSVHERKAKDIAKAEKQMRDLDKQIEGLIAELEGESEEIKKANQECEAEISGMKHEIEKAGARAKRSKEKLKKEQGEKTEDFNKALQGVFDKFGS